MAWYSIQIPYFSEKVAMNFQHQPEYILAMETFEIGIDFPKTFSVISYSILLGIEVRNSFLKGGNENFFHSFIASKILYNI